MKEISKRLNQTPIVIILFGLLVFFLPFEQRWHKLLKGFSHLAFEGQYLPSFFLSRSLDFYITDFLMLAILCVGLKHPFRLLFWKNSQKYLLGFLGACLMSIFLSSAGGKLWPYYRLWQLALPILAYFCLSQKEGLLKPFFWILALTSFLQCVVEIDQYVLQESIGLKYLGEPRIAYHFSPEIQVECQERWLFDKWLGTKTLSKHILRPFGTFPHPNVLAAFLGICFFATCFLYLKTKRKWLAPLLSFQLFGIALTYSRGAIFGVGGAFLGFLLLLSFAKENGKKLLLPFLVGSILSAVILKEQYLHRGGVVGQTASSQASDSMRLVYVKSALEMAKEHPLWGVGYGQYLLEVGRYSPKDSPFPVQKVHNIFVLVLAEVGVIGLLLFLGFIGTLLYAMLKQKMTLERATLLAMFSLILFSGCVDYFWLELQHGKLMLFVILALIYRQAYPPKQIQLD